MEIMLAVAIIFIAEILHIGFRCLFNKDPDIEPTDEEIDEFVEFMNKKKKRK